MLAVIQMVRPLKSRIAMMPDWTGHAHVEQRSRVIAARLAKSLMFRVLVVITFIVFPEMSVR
jgi:hypothetical protein